MVAGSMDGCLAASKRRRRRLRVQKIVVRTQIVRNSMIMPIEEPTFASVESFMMNLGALSAPEDGRSKPGA